MSKNHECAPKDWRGVPDRTGSFELDAVIERCENGDLPRRLKLFLDPEQAAYGPISGYSGYHGYTGDN